MKQSDRIVSFISGHFIAGVTIICLIIYALTYSENCFGPQIRADGEGYYAYLPAYLIYHDPSMVAVAQHHYGGQIPHYAAWEHVPQTGRYLCLWNIGMATMTTPFFMAAHILTKATVAQQSFQKFQYPADGYSFFINTRRASREYSISSLGSPC